MGVEVVLGDITGCDAEVIVNAANETLLGGGGVDGAIHDAAGPGLLAECKTLGGCETGGVRVTGAHDLPFSAIIHTVGPIWRGGARDEERLLLSCYTGALEAAADLGAESIAFPAISTGAYGFPEDRAAGIALRSCVTWVRGGRAPSRVLLMAFDLQSEAVLRQALEEVRGDG